MTIRRATPGDEAALGRFGAALMRMHHGLDPQRFLATSDPERGYGRFLVSQLDDADTLVLVAELDGVVVGYAYASLQPMSWMDLRAACGGLHDVFVDEAVRGRGVGEALVRESIAWLEARDVPRVVLWTAARNPGARRLFERLGFRPTTVEMAREAGGGATD